MNDTICKSCGWKGHHSKLKGAYEEVGLDVIWCTYCPRCESEEVEPLETPEAYFVGYDIETGEVFEEESKLIYLNSAMQVLENEIKWCRDNAALAPGPDSAEWFIKGLVQAKNLIFELSEVDYQTPLANIDLDEIDKVRALMAAYKTLNSPVDRRPKYGTPGWTGDYGTTPFGPVDI